MRLQSPPKGHSPAQVHRLAFDQHKACFTKMRHLQRNLGTDMSRQMLDGAFKWKKKTSRGGIKSERTGLLKMYF